MLGLFECIHLHHSFDFQLRDCSFQVFPIETRLYNCHRRGRSEDWRSTNFNDFLNEFPEFSRDPSAVFVSDRRSQQVFFQALCRWSPSIWPVEGGGDWNANRGSARTWSPQITGTMGQMTADKLSRVEWSAEGERELTCCQARLPHYFHRQESPRRIISSGVCLPSITIYIFIDHHKCYLKWGTCWIGSSSLSESEYLYLSRGKLGFVTVALFKNDI